MTTLSVTVTVSPLVTGDLSTSINTVSTGGLAALGVQFRVKGAPTINGSVVILGRILKMYMRDVIDTHMPSEGLQ